MPSKHVAPVRWLKGSPEIPGDKSISHRAAIVGTLAQGRTRITNFLTAQDCLNTLAACEQLGAVVERHGTTLMLEGRGLRGLTRPAADIDCGNSGTGVRLLSGVLAGQPFTSVITGDAQVRSRPMRRIIEPLEKLGARIESQPGLLCPLRIHGVFLRGLEYRSPVASAQVKSCLLLAGLFAEGETRVLLPAASRDHTERMLKAFGAQIAYGQVSEGAQTHWTDSTGEWVSIQGQTPLTAQALDIPADISSAAFFLVAAALLPGSALQLKNIGMNPTRTGVLDVLARMGAKIQINNQREMNGEPLANLRVGGGDPLTARTISGANLIPRLIDELPILAVAAAAAHGETIIEDATELKVKETDRIGVLAAELRKIGVEAQERPDGLVIRGGEIRGGTADSHGDHRLAMCLAIAGLVSEDGVTVENPECVETSFPQFWRQLDEVRA